MQNLLDGTMLFLAKNYWIGYILVLWAIPWKGVALWKAAKKGNLYWFIAFLVVNTVGLLEILYIFIFSKMEKKEKLLEAAKSVTEESAESEKETAEEINQ